jgi:hypothetical protein
MTIPHRLRQDEIAGWFQGQVSYTRARIAKKISAVLRSDVLGPPLPERGRLVRLLGEQKKSTWDKPSGSPPQRASLVFSLKHAQVEIQFPPSEQATCATAGIAPADAWEVAEL